MAIKTPFSEDRHNKTIRAHKAAREDIYPQIFGVEKEQLEFDYYGDSDTGDASVLDKKHSIDVQVEVSTQDFEHPMPITLQERWRGIEYRNWKDVTVTGINTVTGTKSEHFKISSGYHLYGYHDDTIDKIPEAICFNVPSWQVGVLAGEIDHKTPRTDHKSGSKFYPYSFRELIDSGVVLAYINDGNVVYRNDGGWNR